MIDNIKNFKDWVSLSPREQERVYNSWNKYAGEGESIVREACDLFKKKYGESDDVLDVNCGIYHGGDWIIDVVMRVGYHITIPERFHGIIVKKSYGGLSSALKEKLSRTYNNSIEKFIDSEMEEFSKCFTFTHSSYAKEWLIKFVKDYKDK